MQLEHKNVLLGITGGIAAYKTPDLVRKLKAKGANVRVVLTSSAEHFVSTLSLQAVSGEKVSTHLLDEEAELGMGHIELAKWADIMLIAPATANTIAKLAHGLADDLLTTLVLATTAKLFIAPAMNQQMWHALPTQENTEKLKNLGYCILGPAAGEQACGDTGYGRMMEPEELVDQILSTSDSNTVDAADLAGVTIMITAGPTRESIDPVRYLSNHSSGKMGYAIASAAVSRGASVLLVSGPTNLEAPEGCEIISVVSAQQMYDSVHEHIDAVDIFIACAAVADYKVNNVADEKMKKQGDGGLTLSLVQNPDILKSVTSLKNAPFTVGFAAETQNVIEYARNKLNRKNVNMIAANDVSNPKIGFNSDENSLVLITQNSQTNLGNGSKHTLASKLMEAIASEYSDVTKNNK